MTRSRKVRVRLPEEENRRGEKRREWKRGISMEGRKREKKAEKQGKRREEKQGREREQVR